MAGRRNAPAWIVIDGNTGSLRCQRCGGSEPLPFPFPIGDLGKIGEPFATRHSTCPDPDKRRPTPR